MVWRGGQQPGAASRRTGNVTGVVIQLSRQRSIKGASQVSKNQHGSRDERSSRKLQPRGGNLGDRGGILHLGHRRSSNRRSSNRRFSNRRFSNRRFSNRRFSNRRFSNRHFSNRRTRDRQERRALHESIDVHMSVYSIVCIRFPWAHRPTSSVKLSQAQPSSAKLSQAQPSSVKSASSRRTWADLQDGSLASVPASNFVWQHSLHAGPVLTHSEPTSGVSWAEARAKRAERTAMVFIVRDRFEARSMSF